MDQPQIAELCLAHLVREEACLQSARERLQLLHAAFVRGDWTTLQSAVNLAAQQADETQAVSDARHRFCCSIADELDLCPETVNLTAIAGRLTPPYSTRIAALRDRLQVLGGEVERLTRRVADVVLYCREFFQRAVAEMTDSSAQATVHRYGPTSRTVSNRGSLLAAGG